MRKLQILLVVLFAISTVAFCATFAYNRFFADHEPPVLTSDVEYIEVSAAADDEELLTGLHAQDNVDGDITGRIQVKSVSALIGARSAQVTYVVFDRASNAATLTREVRYTDYRKPRFALSQPLIYGASQTVTLLDRLSASDVVDGNLTSKIQLTMLNLSNNIEGNYQIRVMVSNSLGDSSMLPLTVTIRNDSIGCPQIELSEYLVYTGVNEPIDLESYIKSVSDPSQPSVRISANDVQITSDVDYTTPGVYEAYYQYTGSTGLEYSVILTVVVE